jgi:pimeloyl-ACP methyl ester carboxylesterase
VHGFLGGAPLWDYQVDELSQYFDVIVPELCGYGSNCHFDAADSITGFADEMLALVDSLGVDRFHLMGHSMGGMIVQQMSVTAPHRIRKLICFGTGPRGVMPDRFEPIKVSREKFITQGVANTAKQIASNWFVDAENASGYSLCVELGSQVSQRTALHGLAAMEAWDGTQALATIKQPTLVLWGDSDRSYSWAQPLALWEGIEHSQLAVLPHCGHNAHMEKPDLVNAIVKDFLS